MSITLRRTIALACLALTGCANIPSQPGFSDVAAVAQQRTGLDVHWNQHTDADRAVESRVRTLLAEPLDADSAVQIALLNSPALQARYEELGVAQADVVQAGLLKNPVFDASLRWPDKAPKGPNVEFAVAADFLDVLFIPARTKIASAEFERTKLDVADAVLELSAEVRAAFYQLQGAQQVLELRRTVLSAEDAAAGTAQKLFDAGNISQLDRDNEQALYEQSKLEIALAEVEVVRQRQQLAALMGIAGVSDDWKTSDRLPDPPASDAPLAGLEARAQADRLDLAAAAQQVAALERSLGLEKNTALVSEAQVAINTERETDGQRVTGPQFSVPLPLFDQGQARVARARYQLRQAQSRYADLQQRTVAEVRIAHGDMTAARKRFEQLRDVVLPLRHRIVEQSQLHYNGMLLGVFELLSAKQNEIIAGREYVEALKDYWVARAELERAVGGRVAVSSTSGPATRPATVPATAPATAPESEQHEHHHH